MEAIIKDDLPLSEQQFFDSILSKGVFKKGSLTPEFARKLQRNLSSYISFENKQKMSPKSQNNESMSGAFMRPKPQPKSHQSMSQTLLKKQPTNPKDIENKGFDPIEENEEDDNKITKTKTKTDGHESMSSAFKPKHALNPRDRDEVPTNSGQEPIEEENENESEDSPFLSTRITKDHFSLYQQNIEMDIYIITGYFIMIFLPCFLLFITYIIKNLMTLCKCLKEIPGENIEPIERIKFIFVSLFFLVFTGTVIAVCVFPGIFVIITQYFCMLYLVEYNNYDPELQINSLQILLVMILIFMVSQEISQGVNTGYYLFNLLTKSVKTEKIEGLETSKKIRAHAFVTVSKLIFLIFPIIQIVVVILLLQVSVLIILSSTETLDLIQNFAALYIILEFDNLIFKFIDIFPWKSMVFLILSVKTFRTFSLEKILRSVCLDTKQLFEPLDKKEININFSVEFGKMSYFLVGLKIFVIFGSIGLSLMVNFY